MVRLVEHEKRDVGHLEPAEHQRFLEDGRRAHDHLPCAHRLHHRELAAAYDEPEAPETAVAICDA
eukprot:5742812-Prymnesium_polylepis.3